MNDEKQLLREYVRTVLQEKTTMSGPGSGEMYYGEELGDILAPLKDVSKLIGAEFGQISAQAQAYVEKGLLGAFSAFVPNLEKKFDEIDARAKTKIDKIRNDPEYKKIWEEAKSVTLEGIGDLFFMADPAGFIVGSLAAKNPQAALGAAIALAAGTPAAAAPLALAIKGQVERALEKKEIRDKKAQRDAEALLDNIERDYRSALTPTVIGALSGGVIRELLRDSGVKKALKNSDLTQRIQNAYGDALDEQITGYRELFEEIKRANSLDDLEKALSTKINLGKYEVDTDELTEEEAKEMILKEAKKACVEALIDMLNKSFKEQGFMSTDHPAPAAVKRLVDEFKRFGGR